MTTNADGRVASDLCDQLGPLVEAAGMVNVLNHGSGSCVYSEGCHGVTQEHLERFAELVRADEATRIAREHKALRMALRGMVDAADRIDLDRPTFGDCQVMRKARAALALVDG